MKTVNIQNVCDEFIQDLDDINSYITKCKIVFSNDDKYLSFSHEHAVIMLYKAFERFMMRTMIACLNHTHSHFERKNGIKLGKHINDDVCEFLITKGGYFDFKGKGGLVKILKNTIGGNHKIIEIIMNKERNYGDRIDKLCAVRNYAAHNSRQSKTRALEVYDLKRIASPGSFLKQQGRLDDLFETFKALAKEIKDTPAIYE